MPDAALSYGLGWLIRCILEDMRESGEKYVNPFTDFGFKKIFGEEPNKALLIDFLGELLRDEESKIVDLEYMNNEQIGRLETDRRAIFDLYCRSQSGERFIVELQKTKQKNFKDRSLYYATFPIQEQGKRGSEWDFELKRVYMVAILDFIFDEDKNQPEKFRYNVRLTEEESNELFHDKMNFVYLEMPKFNKRLEDLESHFDKWMYALKNMNVLEDVPEGLREDVFLRLFDIAEIAKFNQDESRVYEGSLKYYRSLNNSLDTAREDSYREGRREGWDERTYDLALKLLGQGVSSDVIVRVTGLSPDELGLLEKG